MSSIFITQNIKKEIAKITEKHILIEDIAHSLSMTCRFNGHTPKFYSVAEHSLLTAYCLEFVGAKKIDTHLLLATMLHDGNEAYVGDIIRPVREFLRVEETRGNSGYDLNWLLSHFNQMIRNKFNIRHLTPEDWALIHAADNLMLDIEGSMFFKDKWGFKVTNRDICVANNLLEYQGNTLIKYLNPEQAKDLFIKEFNDVYKRHVAERGVASEAS